MTAYASRTHALQARLSDAGHAGMIVSDVHNIRYLTGFTGSNALLLVPASGECSFFTDGRYRDQARQQVWIENQQIGRELWADVRRQNLGDWVAETHHLSVKDWRTLGEPGDSGPIVEELRSIKDASEISALREACEISSAALSRLWTERLVGKTERDVALRLDVLMRELGADGQAFDTIVATGPHSAIPHHEPTDRRIAHGDLLKTDFGALVDGYHADCTRTVVIGAASDWHLDIHNAVREAQALGVSMLKSGTMIAEIDAAVREKLADLGYLDYFTTGLGHGVGLLIHEDPFFSAQAVGRIERRMVLTMEPGIYLPGRGGVRIEDTVLVSEAGPDVLTDVTTELMEIS